MSLDLIEKFLAHLERQGKATWTKNKDYFRIDGNTDINKRKDQIRNFNDTKNQRSRFFLISTKAGGIGINLIGANRCIVFDASWNPSYDTQSIFRIYRLGQRKEVYIYRFLSQGTMEEKIYQRQVTKQSLSQRVVDEHQLDRHFTSNELRELYSFEPDSDTSEIPNLPSDDLLRRLLLDCKKWIVRYHDHESLLENKLDEGLSEEDRKAAWDEYEAERNRTTFFENLNTESQFNPMFNMNNINNFNPLTMSPQFTNQMNSNFNMLMNHNILNQNRMSMNASLNNPNIVNQLRQPIANLPNAVPNFNIQGRSNNANNMSFNSNLNQINTNYSHTNIGGSQFGTTNPVGSAIRIDDLKSKYFNSQNHQEKQYWLNQIRFKDPQLYQVLRNDYQSNQQNLFPRSTQPQNQISNLNMRNNPSSQLSNLIRASNYDLGRPTSNFTSSTPIKTQLPGFLPKQQNTSNHNNNNSAPK